MKSIILFICFFIHDFVRPNVKAQHVNPDPYDHIFFPYRKESLILFKEIITHDQDNFDKHRAFLKKVPDLRNHGDFIDNEMNIHRNMENKKHFTMKRFDFFWSGSEGIIPCTIVQYIHESKIYLYEKYKTLRNQALIQLDLMDNSSAENFQTNREQYESILKEIKNILYLVERAYPGELFVPDRTILYSFYPSEEFLEIMKDHRFIPFGSIQVQKIKFANGHWIDFFGKIQGYMNFKTDVNVTHTAFTNIGHRDSEMEILLEREVSPLEACLSDLNIELMGSVQKKLRPQLIVKRSTKNFTHHGDREELVTSLEIPEWIWGPAEDPVRPYLY
jgi:hypothetical protein